MPQLFDLVLCTIIRIMKPKRPMMQSATITFILQFRQYSMRSKVSAFFSNSPAKSKSEVDYSSFFRLFRSWCWGILGCPWSSWCLSRFRPSGFRLLTAPLPPCLPCWGHCTCPSAHWPPSWYGTWCCLRSRTPHARFLRFFTVIFKSWRRHVFRGKYRPHRGHSRYRFNHEWRTIFHMGFSIYPVRLSWTWVPWFWRASG